MTALASGHLGPLRPGARVAVLGTAGPPTPERLQQAMAFLAELGLAAVPYPTALASHPRADYLSGTDRQRADDFTAAWCDPEIEAIVCARGGYGTVRMLDLLDVDRLRAATPTPVYGSSDVTGLHEWLAEHLGVASWFTPMPATGDLLDDPAARGFFASALTQPWRDLSVPAGSVLRPGRAQGRLVGGNLCLLAMTLAARTRPPLNNAGTVVLLEDVGEETYKLDGYLTGLLRAGYFDGVVGLALGSWKNCDAEQAKELVAEAFAGLELPIIADLDLGHGTASRCIPIGVEVILDGGSTPCLTVRDSSIET